MGRTFVLKFADFSVRPGGGLFFLEGGTFKKALFLHCVENDIHTASVRLITLFFVLFVLNSLLFFFLGAPRAFVCPCFTEIEHACIFMIFDGWRGSPDAMEKY
jgi:hypothetical protein